MGTLTKIFPDSDFYAIQDKLKLWIKSSGFVSWKQIQKTCKSLLSAYPEEYIQKYGSFPEYKLFMPLLRNGICEISLYNGRAVYVYSDVENVKNNFDPLLVLNNIPELSRIISTYEKNDLAELLYICDLKDKYTYKKADVKDKKIGIYKTGDKVYLPAFIFDGKNKRHIAHYDKNPDSINVSRCFVRAKNKETLFIYHAKSCGLNVLNYSELPILITRALILFDVSQINKKEFLYPLDKNICYKNICKKAVDELIRIFGTLSVEAHND